MVMPCSRSARRPSVSRAGSVGRTTVAARGLDGGELVGEHGLGVVKQAAHQGGLPVVDAPRGREAEEADEGRRVEVRVRR